MTQGVGIDVGGGSIKWAVVAGTSVLERGSVPTPRDDRDSVVAAIAGLVEVHPRPWPVTVAMPATVDRRLGTTVVAPNLVGDWRDFALCQALRHRTGRSVGLVNDARAFALGELRAGAARGRRNVLFVTIGTGVGGAVALEGRLLSSTGDRVGEIGHLQVVEDGEPCGCGAFGCLETVAGGMAIVRAYCAADGRSPETITAEQVVVAARAGDASARAVLTRAGQALGRAAGSACALLGLDTVVVGGGIAAALDELIPAIEVELARRARLVGPITVLPAQLGPLAGAVGAALFPATDE